MSTTFWNKITREENTVRVLTCLRILIGGIYLLSGLSKLIQPIEYFEIAVGFYDLIPDNAIHYVALIVPWIEFIFGTHLLLGYDTKKSGIILAGLSGIFQVVLAQAVLRDLPVDECGCFGGGYVHLTLYQSFALDTFLVLCLIQIISHRSKFALDNIFEKTN